MFYERRMQKILEVYFVIMTVIYSIYFYKSAIPSSPCRICKNYCHKGGFHRTNYFNFRACQMWVLQMSTVAMASKILSPPPPPHPQVVVLKPAYFTVTIISAQFRPSHQQFEVIHTNLI